VIKRVDGANAYGKVTGFSQADLGLRQVRNIYPKAFCNTKACRLLLSGSIDSLPKFVVVLTAKTVGAKVNN
jgi:hypothetical protein